jgi:hypothetical protein
MTSGDASTAALVARVERVAPRDTALDMWQLLRARTSCLCDRAYVMITHVLRVVELGGAGSDAHTLNVLSRACVTWRTVSLTEIALPTFEELVRGKTPGTPDAATAAATAAGVESLATLAAVQTRNVAARRAGACACHSACVC